MMGHSNSPDPLSGFRDGAVQTYNSRPIPLRDTHIDVRVRGGLAIVRIERTFRNTEAEPIEVTFTFPVPVHATLVGLTARIAGRLLNGKAERKDAARETYEAAIDSGHTAVLHEEALRGIHILSVAHIPSGVEVTVTSVWAQPLSYVPSGAYLRIPTTIADIYGRPPLADGDAPVNADVQYSANLAVACDSGTAFLQHGHLTAGQAVVTMDAPIDLHISDWQPRTLNGRSADGRAVQLDILPAAQLDGPLDVALLVDRSGSMDSKVDKRRTVHDVVREGLRAAEALLRPGDMLEGWQFDDRAERIAERGSNLQMIADALGAPRDGTEIGGALAKVIKETAASDVLLVTDGRSYALDVQSIARTGRRISVVLVGQDALEAMVGYLAALTGGQLFVASKAEAGEVVRAAIASLRAPARRPARHQEWPARLELQQAGMVIDARWTTEQEAPAGEEARVVGAVAASLVLPGLPEDVAASVAAAHGLVTHLTSLVLVDEEGDMQDTLPGRRVVPLMQGRRSSGTPARSSSGPSSRSFLDDGYQPKPMTIEEVLENWKVDWDSNPAALLRGEIKDAELGLVLLIRRNAKLPEVIALANAMSLTPVQAAIGLVAGVVAKNNRGARRIEAQLLKDAPADLLQSAMEVLKGLVG